MLRDGVGRGLIYLGCICALVFILIFSFSKFKELGLQKRELNYNGRVYRDLIGIARDFKMRSGWSLNGTVFHMGHTMASIDAVENGRHLMINGMPVSLGFPLVKSGGRMFISAQDYREVIQALFAPSQFSLVREGKLKGVIVLDAGHGGKDPGAQNAKFNLKEKELTLDLSLRVKSLLEKSGYQVFLTRDVDRYLKLEERSSFANSKDADLFISIHFNAAKNKKAHGIECFALTPQGQASTGRTKIKANDLENFAGNKQNLQNTLLAYCLQKALVDWVGGADRGLKRARFKVLKDLEIPGALVELGFISHAATADIIRHENERQRIAEGLHTGILYYYKKILKTDE